jgi:hypothetical protein
VVFHCQTRYVKFHILFTGRTMNWLGNIFLYEFGLPGSFWLSFIFYVAYCKEFMFPMHEFLFWRGFLVEFVLQNFMNLVYFIFVNTYIYINVSRCTVCMWRKTVHSFIHYAFCHSIYKVKPPTGYRVCHITSVICM